MVLLAIDVIEVKSIYERQSKPDAKGTIVTSRNATMIVEGGQCTAEIADGVDMPEGWSGKAFCNAAAILGVSKYQGDSKSNTTFRPILITQFIKEKDKRSVNAASVFMAAAQSQTNK